MSGGWPDVGYNAWLVSSALSVSCATSAVHTPRIHPRAWCPAMNITEALWSPTSWLACVVPTTSVVLKQLCIVTSVAVDGDQIGLQVRCNVAHEWELHSFPPSLVKLLTRQLQVKTSVDELRTITNMSNCQRVRSRPSEAKINEFFCVAQRIPDFHHKLIHCRFTFFLSS